MSLHQEFLIRNNHTDLQILKNTKVWGGLSLSLSLSLPLSLSPSLPPSLSPSLCLSVSLSLSLRFGGTAGSVEFLGSSAVHVFFVVDTRAQFTHTHTHTHKTCSSHVGSISIVTTPNFSHHTLTYNKQQQKRIFLLNIFVLSIPLHRAYTYTLCLMLMMYVCVFVLFLFTSCVRKVCILCASHRMLVVDPSATMPRS